MIGHLLTFADEATAQAALAEYWTVEGGWRGDICVPNTTVTRTDGETQTVLPGWRVQVLLASVNQGLAALPEAFVFDFEAGAPVVSQIPAGDLALYSVSPEVAGWTYGVRL